MRQVTRSSFKPLYLQISDAIREDIDSGVLSPGDRVWSERFIMDKFTVRRNTAQQAIDELAAIGLVTRIQGKGTYVTEQKVSYGLQRLTSFSEEMRQRGMVPGARVLALVKEHPSQAHAARLRLETKDWVYRLQRLRPADGQPMAYQDSYIPEHLCPGLESYDFSTASLFSILEDRYGLILSWQEAVIKPVIARQEEASLLGISPGAPLLLADGVSYLDDDTPIESKRILYRSDIYEFTVRSTRKPGHTL